MSKIRTQINLPKSWFLEHKMHFDLKSLSAPIDYVCDEFLKNKKIAPLPHKIFLKLLNYVLIKKQKL